MTESPTEQPRILIVGAAGQVGVELQRSFLGFGSIVAVDLESVDLADADQTRALVRRVQPDLILMPRLTRRSIAPNPSPALAMAINADGPAHSCRRGARG